MMLYSRCGHTEDITDMCSRQATWPKEKWVTSVCVRGRGITVMVQPSCSEGTWATGRSTKISEVGERPVQCQTRAKSLVKMAWKIEKNTGHSPTHPQEILGILCSTSLCSMLSSSRVPAQQPYYTPILVSVTTIKKIIPNLNPKPY